ncbi:hypothetical protein F2Q70_00029572 [Brassica cretica]|uniref:Aspartic peptidase DDI1-type domain-containing protein n=1 Tax=Brassica cretica TaxID=69181 RepID=A0A8S9FIA8_BRACR|nr:hypothetical protein F2Q70_00029572 [Brassica cretica]
MPKIDVQRLNELRPQPKPSDNPQEATNTHSDDAADPMEFDRIPLEKPFEEAYFTHRLWMFFRETRETEEDIMIMFCEAREKMKKRITMKKKSDPGKFAIPCTVKGFEFPHALCDTGASISILPRVMAAYLGLKVDPSKESFTFVDCSQRSSEKIVRDLEVQIGNALVPVDFHVLDIKLNWNSSLLLGRAFLSTVGVVCNIKLMERASRDEHNYICLPEHARSFTQTKLVPEIYTKDEINEMFYGVGGAQEKNEGAFQMKLDGVYYPPNDSVSWLTTCMEEMRQDRAKIQHAADKHRPTSIDRRTNKSIDNHRRTSIDEATNRGRLVPKVTSDRSVTHNHEEEISTDTYATLMR